jgi:dihydrofolate synthase/folylpolyglutamate synthase
MITGEEVAENLTAIRQLVCDWEPHPTFFEITTALALMHFKKCGSEVVALETGLGGRLDATNAVEPVVSVITPIGYDHQAWLGNTLEAIAREKAGIIKTRVPIVSAPQEPAAERVLRARAAECGASIEIVSEPYLKTPLALAGSHQKQNASLAIAALRAGGIGIGDEAITRGLADLHWPARFQRWDKRIIIDGAHNPAGAGVLAETWREQFGDERATVILAVLSDKDHRGICEALAPISAYVLLPKISGQRATDPETLAQVFSTIAPTLQRSIATSIADAFELARARPNLILVTGSLHFAGEALATLDGDPAAFEECAQ